MGRMFRILAVGDVVGRPGRRALAHFLPKLKAERSLDAVIVNAENSAAGAGINEAIYREVRGYGADVVTMGDHAFDKKEAFPVYEREDRLLRPANWPKSAPGRGTVVYEGPRGVRVGVIHLQGKVFMAAQGDFFEEADRALSAMKGQADVVVVDIHAEATSEKIALSWHLDGRVALVFGTHTHVPTADATIRRGGSAYITDCGMTGPYDGVIGRVKEAVLKKMRTNVHEPYAVAEGDVRFGGVIVDVDERTGKALRIEPVFEPLPADVPANPAPATGSTVAAARTQR
jgi:metallophosphoesterase (TIGR00282 family)